jgi:hypothetical protein
MKQAEKRAARCCAPKKIQEAEGINFALSLLDEFLRN